jgi:translation initiation factor 1 (eIF-1/SUI1)
VCVCGKREKGHEVGGVEGGGEKGGDVLEMCRELKRGCVGGSG